MIEITSTPGHIKLGKANEQTASKVAMTVADDGKTAVTESGLVVKNIQKIADINTPVGCSVDARFYAWQISRSVRRDFHLIGRKIFMRIRDQKVKAQVIELMSEMVEHGDLLIAETEGYQLTYAPEATEINFEIVHRLQGHLLRILQDVDSAVVKLNCKVHNKEITKETRDQKLFHFMAAYHELKRFLLTQANQSNKTAAELGAEAGIV